MYLDTSSLIISMTSGGRVSTMPKFRRLSEFPSSFDCFLCSLTRATSLEVGDRGVEVIVEFEGAGELTP